LKNHKRNDIGIRLGIPIKVEFIKINKIQMVEWKNQIPASPTKFLVDWLPDPFDEVLKARKA